MTRTLLTSVAIILMSAATMAQTSKKPIYSIVEVSGPKISIKTINAINVRLAKVSSRTEVTRVLDSSFAYLPVKLVLHEELPGQLKSFNYDRSPKETPKTNLTKADKYYSISAIWLPSLFSEQLSAFQHFPDKGLLPDTLIAKDSIRIPVGDWTSTLNPLFVECSNCDSTYREVRLKPDSLGFLILKKEQFGGIDSKALILAIKTSSPFFDIKNIEFYVRFTDAAIVKQIEDLASLVLESSQLTWSEKSIYRTWLFTNTRGVLSSQILEQLIQEMVNELQSGKY